MTTARGTTARGTTARGTTARGTTARGTTARGTTAAGPTTGGTDAAARLSRRYPPPRVSRPLLIVLVAAGSAVALGWLVWAALLHAEPVVSAQVPYYQVTSDTTINVTITVQRRDPSIPVTCRVIAQATDFQPVAEKEVLVAASTVKLADIPVTMTTLRRATSASVSGCTAN